MTHPLLGVQRIEDPPDVYLRAVGQVFAVFDERTQDSGNISYGVQVGGERFFVKTAGRLDDSRAYLPHAGRAALLRNAARLSGALRHPALVRLRHVIDESPHGPLLVYEWAEGELLGAPRSQRDDPASAYQRFRGLPAAEIADVIDAVFSVHDALARLGWIAVDFYDGCLIYDFARKDIHLVDLDLYRRGAFTNEMGRMFGSTRFMAPEEFERGARIDERTNVFTMGRTLAVFLSDGTPARPPFRGSGPMYAVMQRACRAAPGERFASIAAFHAAWHAARQAG